MPKKAAKKRAVKKKAAKTSSAKTSTPPKTPEAYIRALEEPRRSEIRRIHELIRATVPKLEARVGYNMIGYGPFHYKYASGREGDTFRIGLASQKQYISIYCCGVIDGAYVAEAYRDKLPKASIGKSCVRFKRLDDLDVRVLKELLKKTEKSSFGI